MLCHQEAFLRSHHAHLRATAVPSVTCVSELLQLGDIGGSRARRPAHVGVDRSENGLASRTSRLAGSKYLCERGICMIKHSLTGLLVKQQSSYMSDDEWYGAGTTSRFFSIHLLCQHQHRQQIPGRDCTGIGGPNKEATARGAQRHRRHHSKPYTLTPLVTRTLAPRPFGDKQHRGAQSPFLTQKRGSH